MYIGLHFYVKTSWLQNCPVMQKSNSNDLQFKNGSKQLFHNARENVQNRLGKLFDHLWKIFFLCLERSVISHNSKVFLRIYCSYRYTVKYYARFPCFKLKYNTEYRYTINTARHTGRMGENAYTVCTITGITYSHTVENTSFLVNKVWFCKLNLWKIKDHRYFVVLQR